MARRVQRRRMSDRASLLLTIAISPVVLVAIGFAVFFSLPPVFSLIFAAASCETTDESVILAIMAIVHSIAAVLTLIATSYACQSIHRGLRRWWYLDADGDSVFCLSCDYNLARNTSGTCPECGTPIPQLNEEEPDSPCRSKARGRSYGRQRPSVERREVNGEHGTATVARVGLVSRRNGADRLRRSWTPAVLPTLLRTVDRSSLAFGLNASRTSTRGCSHRVRPIRIPGILGPWKLADSPGYHWHGPGRTVIGRGNRRIAPSPPRGEADGG